MTLTWLQSYGFLEKMQTAVVALLLICMGVAAIFTRPDLKAIVLGTLVPTPPRFEPWLIEKYPETFADRNPWVEMVVYLGAIGGGTQDYFGYLGLLRQKAWGMLGRLGNLVTPAPAAIDTDPANIARGRRWLRAPLADVGISFAAVLLFTLAFVILGAAMLHPEHQVPTGMNLLELQFGYLVRPDQPGFLRLVLGLVYKTGVFFAFLGTIWGAYELYTWTTRECLVAAMPSLRAVPVRTFRLATLLWCGLGGLTLLWSLDASPVKIVTPAALVGSSLTCGIWCFAILWSDRTSVPRPLRAGLGLNLLILLAGIVLTIVPAIGLYKYVVNLLS